MTPSQVREERIKLFASFEHRGGSQFRSFGHHGAFGLSDQWRVDAFALFSSMLISFLGSTLLHLSAQVVLGRLES